jgi:hypothetical protein
VGSGLTKSEEKKEKKSKKKKNEMSVETSEINIQALARTRQILHAYSNVGFV